MHTFIYTCKMKHWKDILKTKWLLVGMGCKGRYKYMKDFSERIFLHGFDLLNYVNVLRFPKMRKKQTKSNR